MLPLFHSLSLKELVLLSLPHYENESDTRMYCLSTQGCIGFTVLTIYILFNDHSIMHGKWLLVCWQFDVGML